MTSGRPPSRPSPQTPRTTEDFARAVQGFTGQAGRLQRGVELVVDLVEGCDHAGVTIASRGTLSTPAASDHLVLDGDAWQYELGEGPCVDSVHEQHTVIAQDLSAERRWSRWAPKVVGELGVHAIMSVLLHTDSDSYGALNLYADRTRPWGHRQVAVAHALAGHLAVALADAREIEGRGQAMIGRTVIGQAEGILMERLGLDAERAFDYLRRMSQTSNRKLLSVAEELVATRRLPLADPHP